MPQQINKDLPMENTQGCPPYIAVGRQPDSASQLRVGIGIPACMHRSAHPRKVHHRKSLAVFISGFLDGTHSDLHRDEANSFSRGDWFSDLIQRSRYCTQKVKGVQVVVVEEANDLKSLAFMPCHQNMVLSLPFSRYH